jgi:hypothetical protein
MQYNLGMHQWECHALMPPNIITDQEIASGMYPGPLTNLELNRADREHIALDMSMFLQTTTPPPPSWFTLDSVVESLSKPGPTAERLQKELERDNRDNALEWFNKMPKALKLLYISKDKDSEGMMEQFQLQDNRFISFGNMYGSCQRLLIRAYITRHKEITS